VTNSQTDDATPRRVVLIYAMHSMRPKSASNNPTWLSDLLLMHTCSCTQSAGGAEARREVPRVDGGLGGQAAAALDRFHQRGRRRGHRGSLARPSARRDEFDPTPAPPRVNRTRLERTAARAGRVRQRFTTWLLILPLIYGRALPANVNNSFNTVPHSHVTTDCLVVQIPTILYAVRNVNI